MSNLVEKLLSPGSGLQLKVGLYFGSFNPIHVGHLVIANYLVEYTGIDQLWFVVSPQNPLKRKGSLLDDHQRLEMVHLAIEDDPRFRVSNIEFGLPKPSYTVDTLAYLKDQYPNYSFIILMGSDNLEYFPKWKNHQSIIENYGVLVYPRPGFDKSKIINHPNVSIVENVPLMEISSSFIRGAIQKGKDVRHFLPPKSWKYLDEMNFYKK